MNSKLKTLSFCAGVAMLSPLFVSCDSDSGNSNTSDDSSGTATNLGTYSIRNSTVESNAAVAAIALPYLLGDDNFGVNDSDNFAYEVVSGPLLYLDVAVDNLGDGVDAGGNPVTYTLFTNGRGVVEGATNRTDNLNEREFPIFHTYSVTGDQTFELNANLADSEEGFSRAVTALYGLGGTIGNAFRQRLLVPGTTVTYSRTELQSFVDEINDEANGTGGNVILHPTQDIILDLDQASIRINHTLTSNNEELVRGKMDGTYTIDIIDAVEVTFRRPTTAEIADINTGMRLLTTDHWIMIADGPTHTVTNIQNGNFDLDLTNIETTPVQ